MAVIKSGDITWMDFYKAAKSGEEDIVNRALPTHDFRVWVENTRSVFDLAALHNRKNVVKVILECERIKNLSKLEQSKIIMNALLHPCRLGHVEMTEFLLNALYPLMQDLNPNEKVHVNGAAFLKLYLSGLGATGGSLELIQVLETFTSIVFTNEQLESAFRYGHRSVFKHLLAKAKMDCEAASAALNIPILFVHIAINNMEDIKTDLDTCETWFVSIEHKIDRYENVNAFDIASLFGDIEVLELLVEKSLTIESINLAAMYKNIYRRARDRDNALVVKWLDERGEIDWDGVWYWSFGQHVRSLKVFTYLCNRLVALIKEDPQGNYVDRAYLGLNIMCRDACESEYPECEVLKVCVRVFGHDVCDISDASRNDVADCAQVIVEGSNEWSCLDNARSRLHSALKNCLGNDKHRKQRLPSPAMVECLLDVLPRGSSCECGENVPLDMFLQWEPSHLEKDEVRNGRSKFFDNFSEFTDILEHVRIYMSILGRHGVIPRHETVENCFKTVFDDNPRTYQVARALWLGDWLGVEWIKHYFCLYKRRSMWGTDILMSEYKCRDLLITHVLRLLSGTSRKMIMYGGNTRDLYWWWDGFLVYILSPRKRREHFVKCINKLGLVIKDEYLEQCADHIKSTAAYAEVEALTRPRWFNLQTRARLTVHRHLRLECDKYVRKATEFMPLSRAVQVFCARHEPALPKSVYRHMAFQDLFEEWDGGNFTEGINVLAQLLERQRREDIIRLRNNPDQ